VGSTVEELIDLGVKLRFAVIGAYAVAFVGYAARLAVQKIRLDKLATWVAVLGVTGHTAYLATRWIAAGQTEVLMREKGGDIIAGSERFWLLVSHPPYTNLFDALNFVAWALMVCYLIVERKWGLRIVGALAVAIALVAMGEASLVSDKLIEPLVPALQSYWILIHVGMLFISYSLFTLGAACALLYLVRTGVATAALGTVTAAMTWIFLSLVGGGDLLGHATFKLAPAWMHEVPSKLHAGKFYSVATAVHYFPPGSDKAAKYTVPIAGVGPLLLLAAALFVAATVVYAIEWSKGEADKRDKAVGFWVFVAAFASLTAGLGVLVYNIVSAGEVKLPEGLALAPGEHGPFHLNIASNYTLGLIALLWGATLGFLLTALFRERISAALPEPRKLEDITYRVVIAGWPLLTIGIVMGGMWAYEAWGRFWGWDPKETWALITWVVYAGYLHTRITMGWAGKRPAVIAVFAFMIVVFTFMGVNLGLTGEGLHTYGAG
jgi:ABC-type transport system involved in cytochrome c biogenesis permease subunit